MDSSTVAKDTPATPIAAVSRAATVPFDSVPKYLRIRSRKASSVSSGPPPAPRSALVTVAAGSSGMASTIVVSTPVATFPVVPVTVQVARTDTVVEAAAQSVSVSVAYVTVTPPTLPRTSVPAGTVETAPDVERVNVSVTTADDAAFRVSPNRSSANASRSSPVAVSTNWAAK